MQKCGQVVVGFGEWIFLEVFFFFWLCASQLSRRGLSAFGHCKSRANACWLGASPFLNHRLRNNDGKGRRRAWENPVPDGSCHMTPPSMPCKRANSHLVFGWGPHKRVKSQSPAPTPLVFWCGAPSPVPPRVQHMGTQAKRVEHPVRIQYTLAPPKPLPPRRATVREHPVRGPPKPLPCDGFQKPVCCGPRGKEGISRLLGQRNGRPARCIPLFGTNLFDF